MRNDTDHSAIHKVPAWGWAIGVLLVVVSWLPLALIARSRAVPSSNPPIHLFLDMDFQPRYGPQDPMPMMADSRAMRPPVLGAVRADGLEPGVEPDDDHFYRGYQTDGNLNPVMVEVEEAGVKTPEPKYISGFPPSITLDRAFIERGRERFNIYCSVCHGRSAEGDGPVYERVKIRQGLDPAAVQGFPAPRNMHLPKMLQYPEGKLFDRITRGFYTDSPEGKRTYTMWPYAAQVPPRDRWAIVAWIRVMQDSQYFPADRLPEALKANVASAPEVQPPLEEAPPPAEGEKKK